MSKPIPFAPIAMTPANQAHIQALFGKPESLALKQYASSAAAARLLDTVQYNGHTMRTYQVDLNTQIGVLSRPNGSTTIFSPVSAMLVLSADGSGNATGVTVFVAQTDKSMSKGEVGAGVTSELVTDEQFRNDIAHVMKHDPAVNMPHDCSAPPPKKHNHGCDCC